jgi:glycosyltransferase involved in cell wall biosynthesis
MADSSLLSTPASGALEPPSVLILTKNEERNIEACIRTLDFTDDIVVLDSLSNDQTVEIARSLPNVRVAQRRFDTEYKQRNYGLQQIAFKHPWVYICDADERVPAELAGEMVAAINDPHCNVAAFRLRYKNMYMNRWIKHSSSYPLWLIRLVRPASVEYETRQTNVHLIVHGPVGNLQNHFLHYSFNLGLRHWFRKHNYYSTLEALEGVKVRRAGLLGVRGSSEIGVIARRRRLKNLSYFLAWRALWRFLHAYCIRLGFLDGRAGFHYCLLISMYEYWIEVKIQECERRWRQLSDREVKRLLAEEPT